MRRLRGGEVMTRQEKIAYYIRTIHESGYDLDDWEKNDFLPSVARQFNSKGDLSDKQLARLEQIYSDKTPTGSCYGEPADDILQNNIRKMNRVRNEGYEPSRHEDNLPGRSTERRGWRERGYDD